MRKAKGLNYFKLDIQKFGKKVVDTTAQLISTDITPQLLIVNPGFSPVVSYLLKRGKKTKTSGILTGWVTNRIRPVESRLTKALTASETAIEVEKKDFLVEDSLLEINDEIMYIVSVDAANPLKATVTRGYGDSTASEHKKDDILNNLGIMMEEGGDLKPSLVTEPDLVDNITGILYESYTITETMKHTALLGQGDYTAREIESEKKKDELMNILEKGIISSVRFQKGLSRRNDGIKSLIKKHGITIDATSAILTKDLFDKIAEKIVEAGGENDLKAGKYFILAPFVQQNKIDNFNKDTIRTNQTETVTGTKITEVVTTGGVMKVFSANSLKPTEIIVGTLDDVEIPFLYGIQEGIAGKSKLADEYYFDAEYTVKVNKLHQQVLIENLAK